MLTTQLQKSVFRYIRKDDPQQFWMKQIKSERQACQFDSKRANMLDEFRRHLTIQSPAHCGERMGNAPWTIAVIPLWQACNPLADTQPPVRIILIYIIVISVDVLIDRRGEQSRNCGLTLAANLKADLPIACENRDGVAQNIR